MRSQDKVFGPKAEDHDDAPVPLHDLPSVSSTISTLRHAMVAMNVDPEAALDPQGSDDAGGWLNKLTNWI